MTSHDLLAGISYLFMAYGGILILAGLLPIVAAFLLDGVVQVLRSNGLRYFLLALGLTVAVAGVGYVIFRIGMGSPAMTSTTVASVTNLGSMFLTFSIPLALLAFVIRTGKLFLSKRRPR